MNDKNLRYYNQYNRKKQKADKIQQIRAQVFFKIDDDIFHENI